MNYHKLCLPPLVVPAPFFAICGGDGTCAILLSYLYEQCLDGPKMIPYPEIMASLHMSQPPINRARGHLKRAGYLEESNNTVHQKIVYTVLYDAVDAEIMKWLTDDEYEHPSLKGG